MTWSQTSTVGVGHRVVGLGHDAGVVVEAVEPAVGRDGVVDHRLGVGFLRDVDLDEGRLAAGGADRGRRSPGRRPRRTRRRRPWRPRSANICAATRPMPPPAPVMIVTLSASRILAGPSLASRAPASYVPCRAPARASRAVSLHPCDWRSHMAPAADMIRGGRRRRRRARQRAACGGPGARQRPRRGRASRRCCCARYRFDRPTMDALLAADPELDVFEAAALGTLDRVRASGSRTIPTARRRFSPDGFTALHFAAFFGKPEAARVLLEAGAVGRRLHRATTFANQPLHAAAAGRHIEVCRVLLAAGADVNATQHGGLHAAPRGGPARRRRDGRAVPVGRCGSDDRGRATAAHRPTSPTPPVMSTSRAAFARSPARI